MSVELFIGLLLLVRYEVKKNYTNFRQAFSSRGTFGCFLR
jgi:hypothetical protein